MPHTRRLHIHTKYLSSKWASDLFFCRGYECDRLLRTRIGRIEGIPLAKAVAAVAAPVEECRGPGTAATLGDAMDLEPGQ